MFVATIVLAHDASTVVRSIACRGRGVGIRCLRPAVEDTHASLVTQCQSRLPRQVLPVLKRSQIVFRRIAVLLSSASAQERLQS